MKQIAHINPQSSDFNRLVAQVLNALQQNQLTLKPYAKAKLPVATNAGEMVYVTDEAGGAVPAFSDGLVWRRVTDRAVVS